MKIMGGLSKIDNILQIRVNEGGRQVDYPK